MDDLEPTSIPQIPKIPAVTETISTAEPASPSRSSSADLLDAFEFFNPATEPSKDNQHPVQQPPTANNNLLTSPEIKIIAASNENLANNEDDLNYLDSLASKPTIATAGPSYSGTSHTYNSGADLNGSENLLDDMDPFAPKAAAAVNHVSDKDDTDNDLVASQTDDNELHIDTSSSSDSEPADSDNGGRLVRDDSMDFDEIMHRPAAKDSIAATKMASEVWAGTGDSGIGVEFKATFSVSRLFILANVLNYSYRSKS